MLLRRFVYVNTFLCVIFWAIYLSGIVSTFRLSEVDFESTLELYKQSEDVLWQAVTSWGLWGDILWFFGGVFSIVLFSSLLQFYFNRFLHSCSGGVSNTLTTILSIFLFVFILLLHNAAFYEVSKFSFLNAYWEPPVWSVFLLFFTYVLFAVVQIYKEHKRIVFAMSAVSCVIFSVVIFFNDIDAKTFDKPNVIIIGIDGLRYDRIAYSGFTPSVTPNIDQFIEDSTIYPKVYTPIARTHAAWMSLLTGKYPIENGVRFNLTDVDLSSSPYLVSRMKDHGYKSVYTMDERRFNNIDENYGFDVALGPKTGVADFILGFVADNPYINLIHNTFFVRYLLPTYAYNRALTQLYNPESYVDAVLNQVAKVDASSPLFLNVHFTYPHWPYTGSQVEIVEGHDFNPKSPWHYLYLTMLKKVDRQFGQLMNGLSQQGFLDNSIVIVFSDHGESFRLEEDQLSQGNPYASFNTDAAGHGTSVLSDKQYRVVLAIKDTNKINPEQITSLVSLVDIAPSLTNRLGLDDSPFPNDRLDLFGGVNDKNRAIFSESSLTVDGMDGSSIDAYKAATNAIGVYNITNSGHLVFNPELETLFSSVKQKAVYFQEWQLVSLPDFPDDFLLINWDDRTWYPTSAKVPDHAPVDFMKSQLCYMYSKEMQGC